MKLLLIRKLSPVIILFFSIFGNIFGQTFTRITTGAIVNNGGQSYGTAWGDYNNDGYLDLFVSNCCDEANFLYYNNGDGMFTRITNGDIVNEAIHSEGISCGDYNQDNFLDLVVGSEPCLLYQNNGDETFTKITTGDIVNDPGGFPSWGDYDSDGDLDLVVGGGGYNSLYKNIGNGIFNKITYGDIVWNDGNSPCWIDYDNDDDLDLFVANYGDNNCLYQNNGNGIFIKITTGEVVNDSGAFSSGSSWGDYDNDGDLDLFVANGGFDAVENNFLYTNNGDGSFTKITYGDIVNDGGQSNGSSWVDYDNDGDLDLYVTNGGFVLSQHNNFLYDNNGDGTFTKNTTESITIPVEVWYWSLGHSWGDYDNDGDLDLFVANDNGQNNYLYTNNGNSNNWINLKLLGIQSNTSAIGAKVKVKATINGTETWQLREISGQTGYFSQNSLNVEFGLGDASSIDSIKIEWPSGIVEYYFNTAVNCLYIATENLGLFPLTKNVYPGDTDNNGAVNEMDVLPIGIYFLNEVIQRQTISFAWQAQELSYQPGSQIPYADANGDGLIDEQDVIGIGVNWGNSHTSTAKSLNIDPAYMTFLRQHKESFHIIYNSLSGESEAVKTMKTILESILEIDEVLPVTYSLEQNFPNPFNPKTKIRFSLPENQLVTIIIYNTLGQVITIPVKNKLYGSGVYTYMLDASLLPSGLYIYQIKTENWSMARKMVILK